MSTGEWHEYKMVSPLTVQIAPPLHRGMWLAFSANEQEFRENFSTQVYPFLEDLISAIRILRTGFIDERIRLHLGAPECEITILADAGSDDAILRLDMWKDAARSKFTPPQNVFSFEGTRNQIVQPFVDALVELRSNVSDPDFEREYGQPFPQAQFDRLMAKR